MFFENTLFSVFKNKKQILVIKYISYAFYFGEQKTILKNSFKQALNIGQNL